MLDRENGRLRAQLATTEHRASSAQEARNPVARRRELGAMLRALRVEKQMTVEQVAEHLFCSPSKVNRMETGFRSGTVRDVRDLCELYGVTEAAQRDHLMELVRESKQQGWWQSYDLPYSDYVGLEADAASIKNYHSTVVPGLLQTVAYANAIQAEFSPEMIEKRVEVRLIRQRLLTEADPPRFWSILDEAVLHRVVGGAAAMRAQLERLIEVSRWPNVTIQVIPYEVGAHPGADSCFEILEFAGLTPSIVYVEGLIGNLYLERPHDVKRYQKVFESLRAIGLNQELSIDLITQVSRDLRANPETQRLSATWQLR